VRVTVGGDRLDYSGEVATYEYLRLPLAIIPDEIIGKYNLKSIAVDGWVYLEIRKVMYGLKQAGLLANQLLQKRLEPYGD
jgi:hypothetical protein